MFTYFGHKMAAKERSRTKNLDHFLTEFGAKYDTI